MRRFKGQSSLTPVRWLAMVLGLLSALFVVGAGAAPVRVVVSMPGPHLAPYLPLELISRIGADAAEGIQLEIRYFGGGPPSAQDMLERNSDFAGLALAAMAGVYLKSPEIVSVAAIVNRPAYTLLLKKGLRGQVRNVSDLRGRVVGVHSSKQGNKSTGQQLVEYMLLRAGVAPEQVKFVSIGQKKLDYSAALDSDSVDALIANEPEASLLVKQDKAVVLADLHDEKDARAMLGGPFLYAQICTRREVVNAEPEKVRRMVAALGRALAWIQGHTPEQIVDALALSDEEIKAATIDFLHRHKDIYNATPAFSAEQITNAENFFRAVRRDAPAANLGFKSIIEPKWAGQSR